MSDTNRVTILYGGEHDGGSPTRVYTYGVSPTHNSSVGVYSTLRTTGESMHQETSTITSAEIRADRQIADVVRSNLSVAGDTGFELSYSFSELMLAAVMSDQALEAFTSIVTFTSAAELIATASGSKFTEDGSGGNFDDMSPGQWILTSGFSNAANNGYFKIKTITGTAESMVMEVYGTLVDEAASATPAMTQGGQVVNGSKQRSYTIQRVHEDIDTATSGRSAAYSGCMIDGMTLSATTEAVVTGSFSWIGAKGASNNTELGTAHVDATTNDVMNSIDDVDGVMEGTTYASQNITAFTMSLGNNLRPRLEIGTLGAVSIGTGTCNVSGTFQRYYSDATMIDKYLNFNDSALAIVFDDVDGNAYCLEFPKIIYTSAQSVAGGQNQDLIADMSWEAIRSDAQYNPADGSGNVDEGITIRITKWTGLGSGA